MPVTYLEIENFKSYSGQQTIGPFRDFTSVIGPNGSGKSNLMDAISFVLGVQSRDLRSSQMKDLIFRPPGKILRQDLRACVTLYFQQEDEDNESGEPMEIAYSRAISPQGVGEYIVNGKTVTYAKYEERLADIGVLVKARNFLVFQGDVESIARKTPKEMVTLLEQICSSIDLAPEYEACLKAKEEADQAVLFEFHRSKGFKSERKLLKEQKHEAEKFQQLLQDKAHLQTERYLWELFHIDSDMQEQEDTNMELQKEEDEKRETEEQFAEALKEAKKKASTARRHTQNVDKARVKRAAAVDKLEPDLIQATEEILNLKKKIATAEKQLAKKKKDAANHQGDLDKLEKEVEDQQEKLAQLEKDYEEIKRDATGDQVTLTEEQEEELEKVKQAAKAATVEPRRKLTALNRKLTASRSKASKLQSDLEDAQKAMAEATNAAKEFQTRKDKLQASMESTKTELEEKQAELLGLQQELQAATARREELDSQLEQIHKTLAEAKDSKRLTRDQERIAQAIATLKRNFPGVHGRLVDLCKPTQRRFNMAITVAAGRDMDGIVVDTRETGVECMKYLKENRVGVATFLPLDNLQIPSADQTERQRAMIANDSRYRLAADCITCDDVIRPAVLYAVGNTVVCDDLNCARELAFGKSNRGGNNRSARCKAVTLGGAVISKAGTMTGGVTREDNNKSRQWGANEVEKLRERKEKLEQERSELDSASDGAGGRGSRRGGALAMGGRAGRVEELKNNLGSLQSKNHYTKSDMDYTEKSLRTKELDIKNLKKSVAKLKKDAANAEKEFEKLSKNVQQAKEAVKNAEEEHLGPFREKTGLQDLSAYEEAVGEQKKEFKEQKHKLSEHIAKLEQKRDYEKNRDFAKPLKNLEKRIGDNKKKLETTQKRETQLEEQVDKAKAELADAEEKVKESTEAEKSFEEEVEAAQAEYAESQSERNKANKAVNSGAAALERLRATLHETLQRARVEEVELPMLDDNSSSTGDAQSQTTRSSNSQAAATQDSSMPHFSQEDSRKVVKDKRTMSKINYAGLKEEMKQRPSEKEEKRMKKEFEERINSVIAEIEETSPNMKAAEAFESVTRKLKDTNTDYDKARENQRNAAAAFQDVKSRRARMFNDAFNHIDESLKTIYTDMTRSSKHPLGGNAYLSLDDTEEPYKGGMKFNAMPPMKRFRDMEQLSGGEKTVAALSLLFAIHSFHPAPFFVMDEVDAALDNINLRKVCNYISQRSKSDFQCIVISLKDMFFERSESLVGVCKDVGAGSSRTLTLDLTQFDKNEPKQQIASPKKEAQKAKKRKNKSEGDALGTKRRRTRASTIAAGEADDIASV